MLQFSKIAGRYAIERPLYSRGGASGYLARDERAAGQFVVLELSSLADKKDEAVAKEQAYRDVVGVLYSLDHPNLVSLREFVVDAPYSGVVKAHEEGQILANWLSSEGASEMPEAARVSLCRDVLEGLAALHEMSVLHRQVAIGNIWLAEGMSRPIAQLDRFDRAVLAPEREYEDRDRLPVSALDVAPEVRRRGMWSTRSDVYAAGLVLMEILSGRTVGEVLGTGAEAAGEGAPQGASPDSTASLIDSESLTDEIVRSVVASPFAEVVIRATRPYQVERFEDGLDLLAAFDAVDLERRLAELAFLD